MTRPFLFLLPVLFSSCAPFGGNERVFQVRFDLTKQELSVMQHEAELLCGVTDGEFCFEFTREAHKNQVLRMPLVNAYASQTYVGNTSLIALDVNTSDSLLPIVFRHELGHAAGCEQHLSAGHVMSAYVQDMSDTWTQDDLDCLGGY